MRKTLPMIMTQDVVDNCFGAFPEASFSIGFCGGSGSFHIIKTMGRTISKVVQNAYLQKIVAKKPPSIW